MIKETGPAALFQDRRTPHPRPARYFTLQLADATLTESLFQQILGHIERLAWHPTWSSRPPRRRTGLRALGGAAVFPQLRVCW